MFRLVIVNIITDHEAMSKSARDACVTGTSRELNNIRKRQISQGGGNDYIAPKYVSLGNKCHISQAHAFGCDAELTLASRNLHMDPLFEVFQEISPDFARGEKDINKNAKFVFQQQPRAVARPLALFTCLA